jgi:hypothetical protein
MDMLPEGTSWPEVIAPYGTKDKKKPLFSFGERGSRASGAAGQQGSRAAGPWLRTVPCCCTALRQPASQASRGGCTSQASHGVTHAAPHIDI